MTAHARGVFAAPANTPANPKAASREKETGIIAPKALPKVEPIKTNGINSPPLKPDAMVREEKKLFKMGSRNEDIFTNASWMNSVPNPM